MKASDGVLYEYLDQVVHEIGDAICTAWQDIYHISDDEMESPEKLSCSELLGLAADFANEVEYEKKVKRSAS